MKEMCQKSLILYEVTAQKDWKPLRDPLIAASCLAQQGKTRFGSS